MSRSYYSIDKKLLSCGGPNANIVSKEGVSMNIEKGMHIDRLVIFTNCIKEERNRESSNGNCTLDVTGKTKCRYYGLKKEELEKYFSQ